MPVCDKWPALLATSVLMLGCSGGNSPPAPMHTVGGAVSGLAGTGLILTLNGGSALAAGASGGFTFSTGLASGTAYTVAVATQPVAPSQTCVVTNATGTINDSGVANVSVACTTDTFSVRGTIEGLAGTDLGLRLNSGATLSVSANGDFAFPERMASGLAFNVTVSSQPRTPFQSCVAADSMGVVGSSDISVTVTCTTDRYSVGGVVAGLTGGGLVLRLNGTQDLPISGNGAFTFPGRSLRGSSYAVTIASQPATYRELCAVGNGSGVGTAIDVTNVTIDCGATSGFVYEARTGADGQIRKYGIHAATGRLLPLGLAAVTGDHLSRLVVAPNSETLYAVSLPASAIRAFSIDPANGNLSAVAGPVGTGGGWGDQTVIHPSGDFLYVFNIAPGTVTLMSIDPATGALASQGNVASSIAASSYSSREHLAVTPDGSYLYVLNYAYGDPQPRSLTTYSINATTGALTLLTTSAMGNVDGITMDPLGRFLFLRGTTVAQNVASAEVAVYPYSIDAATGALTPSGVTTTAPLNSGSEMIVDRLGRFAYILGTFNYMPGDNRIDGFAIDSISGALTANGAGVVTPSVARGMAIDSAGRFLFAGAGRPPGTYDASRVWCDGATFAVGSQGPTEGQPSAAGAGCGIGSGGTVTIAVVE